MLEYKTSQRNYFMEICSVCTKKIVHFQGIIQKTFIYIFMMNAFSRLYCYKRILFLPNNLYLCIDTKNSTKEKQKKQELPNLSHPVLFNLRRFPKADGYFLL